MMAYPVAGDAGDSKVALLGRKEGQWRRKMLEKVSKKLGVRR